MIIIGFPGIGKSSVTRAYEGDANTTGYIDLESSNFVKDDNWVKEYCDLALDLDLQGYNVFVSSHKNVREYLVEKQDIFPYIMVIFPSKEIRTEWLNRLESRYMKCKTDKNERALSYMRNNFDDAVDEMEHDAIVHKVLITKENMNDLKKAMVDYWNKWYSE
jgi:broad-specificity NMP kinase